MAVKKNEKKIGTLAVCFLLVVVVFSFLYFGSAVVPPDEYMAVSSEQTILSTVSVPKPFVATHIKTPEPLKGVYMTSWVAGTPTLRNNIVRLVSETELNALVIDIKDNTGRISYEVSDSDLKEIGSEENRIKDLREFIAKMHEEGIYIIGRIAVFQDPYMVRRNPELAVKKFSDGAVWRDHKGLSWIDPGATDHWGYIVKVAA